MFNSGSFTTSTPIQKEFDSGFYENSPFRSSSPSSAGENLDCNCLSLRKNLFGKRSISENIPDHRLLHKNKLPPRNSTFSHRGDNSNKETPRSSRSSAVSYKPVHFSENKIPHHIPEWILKRAEFAGVIRSKSPNSESHEIPLLPLIEKLHHRNENSKEESLAYFERSLNFAEAKNCNDVSASDLAKLYFIHRFQRRGLKPTAEDIVFYEKHLLNANSEMFLLWKDKLEHISATVKEPKIDFLGELHKMNAHSIVTNILSYLSGSDLQNASCVAGLWRKLVLEDKSTNRKRRAYLKEKQMKEEMEKKRLSSFQRPPNFRIMGNIENIPKKQLQLQKTIKEINFDAFMEVGKRGDKYKPMKCPSCANLSLPNKQAVTKYNCVFCGYEFCCNCLKPYTNWHFCASTGFQEIKRHVNRKKYLRRL